MGKLNLGAAGESFSEDEWDLLRQVIAALRELRYGSVTLTVHDGHVVEIQKTEKIRTGNLSSGRLTGD
jgi:hypothetical protein